jgi:ABC-type dipeptide/oligopeptide/nickel transport system permease component
MLRYALRRVLWAIPTLLATSLVLFLVTTLAPDPPPGHDDPVAEEARRARFVDLPRFVNTSPQDVESRSVAAARMVAAGGAGEARGARTLRRLGGAALPYVLPKLETLPPEARGRVAVALAPVALRMGVGTRDDLLEPASATLFWSRFWDDRALDFTRTAVDRTVVRLVEHGTDLREADLVRLDTYALPEIMRAMVASHDHVTLERLTRIAHHATDRGPVIEADADEDQVRRAVANWEEWWFVHGTELVSLDGASRAIAVVTETRYGKWLRRAASGELGISAVDGEPIVEKLRLRAPVTLLLCGLAMLFSLCAAVPLGAIGAWRRGKPFDWVSSAAMFLLYSTPTFAVAELLRRLTGGHAVGTARIALAITALSVGSVATLSRWQRAAMLDVVRQDFVRTALAKGLPMWRVAVVHALRNALMPTVTLAGLHLPVVLGGAFVVEEVFGLPGLGFETVRAIEAHDAAWLMAVILACAVVVTLGLIASDVVQGALDPRVRDLLGRRQGGGA